MISEPTLSGIGNIDIVGGYLCLDFANTVHNYEAGRLRDEVTGYGDLVTWAERLGVVDADRASVLRREAEGHPRRAAGAVQRARSLRRVIYDVFGAVAEGKRPEQKDIDRLTAAWGKAARHACIQPSADGFCWRWSEDETDLEYVLWPVIRSATELLTSSDLGRVRRCESRDCTWLFVDKSKNKSRRWCEMKSCGNREKSRRHYERSRPH